MDPEATFPPGVLAYKIALAILGTLQEKGLLSEEEVQRVLLAAKLSAVRDLEREQGRSADPQDVRAVPIELDLDLSGRAD